MFCRNCGAELDENSKFCRHCGCPTVNSNTDNTNTKAKEIRTDEEVQNDEGLKNEQQAENGQQVRDGQDLRNEQQVRDGQKAKDDQQEENDRELKKSQELRDEQKVRKQQETKNGQGLRSEQELKNHEEGRNNQKVENDSEERNYSNSVNKKKYITICSIIIAALVCIIGILVYKNIAAKNGNATAKKQEKSNNVVAADSKKSKEPKKTVNENKPKKQTKVTKTKRKAKIDISQVNTDNFPLIKVYFDVVDDEGVKINNLNGKCFKLIEKFGNKSNNNLIADLNLLTKKESLNLNLVMDISGSMSGGKIEQAQSSANNFLDIVNYNAGDKIEIISFDDAINIEQPFTNDKKCLKNAINNLSINGATAFYDSLYTALVETNKQFGHKCVIAFTDGIDNQSYYSENDIVNLSKQLSIPIYIIGIGDDVETQNLKNLALQTGGDYKSISDINSIEKIYKDIFKSQKEQYVLTYTTKNSRVSNDWRTVNINLNNDKYTAKGDTQFIPKQAINVDTSNITVNNDYENPSFEVDSNLKEELMNTINKYNSYWFAAMSNKNSNLIVNATQKEKDRTNVLIQKMKNSNKSYVGFMTKTIFDLDSVELKQENGQYAAYISDSEYFKDIYYTGSNPQPLPNHKLWKYKLVYDNNYNMWLVDAHLGLDTFNPVNKREF
ncbi:VWA domain-containing protein [Haloimpatiens sp. FM7330]|uniref:VWA domain-containing protein n=1 Tax=Haloimpatiens sp. FM7330 TaxID=3298610 RepID=UPI00363C61F0